MEFEWDEKKRFKNIEKHGLDFLDADIVFRDPYLQEPAKEVHGEQRWRAIGLIDDIYVTVVFTRRGSVIRIISMRRARNGERRKHQEVYGS